MEQKNLSIQSSVIWNAAGSIFYLGCQWLLTIIVVRIAGVTQAGVLSLSMSVCNIWYCIAIYGMRNFQVSDTINQYNDNTYVFSRIVTSMAALLGCLIYSLTISYTFQQRICILLYYVYKFSEAMADVYAGIFQKRWRFDYIGKSMIIRGVLTLVIFTAVLKVSESLSAAIGCMALACIGAVLVYDMSVSRRVSGYARGVKMQSVKCLLKECLPLVVYTLLSTSIATVPRLFMERLLGSYELGIYGSVATPTLIIQMGATYVFSPFVTIFAERYRNKDKKNFLIVIKRCSLAVLLISFVGILGGKILGRWGLLLLYGEEVAEYEFLLVPLIMCTILTAFSWLICGILTAIRDFRGLVVGNLGAVVISAVCSYVFEQRFGMQGASLALGLATLVEIVIISLYLRRNIKEHFG